MIRGVFFDLGGTLRICDPAPEHQAAAARRMAELAGEPDPKAFLERIDRIYEDKYRTWALGENKEAGDYELWADWLLPELPEEKLREICHEMTYQYRQVKGLRRVVDGGYEVIESANMRIDCEEGSFEVTYNGNGSITLKRLAPWHTWFALHAVTDDEYGKQDFWNNYDFDFIGRWMFSDVDINTPHVSDILWLANAGITTGWKMPDGNIEFRGMSPVVRQDMAAFLYRLAGSPQYVPTPQDVETFRDVNSKTPHATEIWWLASTGISKGWDMHDGTFEFRGTSTVVRQDMAAFLRRLTKWMGGDDSLPENVVNPFRDVTDGTAHREAIIWLASTGVTTGWTEPDGSKTYRGMSPVVRQDMAAFLHRLDTYIRDHPNVQIDYS